MFFHLSAQVFSLLEHHVVLLLYWINTHWQKHIQVYLFLSLELNLWMKKNFILHIRHHSNNNIINVIRSTNGFDPIIHIMQMINDLIIVFLMFSSTFFYMILPPFIHEQWMFVLCRFCFYRIYLFWLWDLWFKICNTFLLFFLF